MGRVMMPRRAAEMTAPVPKETDVTVEITGEGSTGYAAASFGGTEYYTTATFVAQPGDSIQLGVRGHNTDYPGTIQINSHSYLNVTEAEYQTMLWTVPDDVTTITIALSIGMPYYNGAILVTTN